MRSFLIPLAVALTPVALIAPPALVARAQVIAPIAQTVISSVAGREGTLNAGSGDGIRAGAIYEVVRDGRVVARARVTRIYAARSEVRFLDVAEGFVVTVGDTARFVQLGPAPVQPQVVAPAPVVNPVAPTPVIAAPIVTEVTPVAAPVAPRMIAMRPTMPMIVTLNGDTVEIGAGSDSGLVAGKTVPVVRDGNIIALVRLTAVTPTSSTGTIVFRDEAAGVVRIGDAMQWTGGGSGTMVVGEDNVPSARVRFETGGGNFKVPKSDRTYDMLAALAADRLITSLPAWAFHDDGSRRHRTDEDLTFTRADIATFVREALRNSGGEASKTSSRLALADLSSKYRSELEAQGVTQEQLSAVGARSGFAIGISGQMRASLVGGESDNYFPAFSERNGSKRARSGFDTRTNILGSVTDRLTFSAQVDAGSDRQRGTNDRNYEVRRAVASYDAGNVLRGLSVDLGRQEYWWGPGHFGTLALSDNAGPLNSLRTQFKRGSYSVESLYSPLGNNRSFYGHNIQVKLSDQVRIGFSETVIAPNRSLDGVLFASTFSPIPLTLAQRASREQKKGADQTNLLNSAYFEAGLASGFTGYGELLIDDLSFTDASRVRQRIGTLIGAHLFKPNDPGKLGLYAEYANLEGRTYLRFRDPQNAQGPGYDYYYRGTPLGFPVAPTQGPSPEFPGGTPGLGGASSLRTDAYWRPTSRLNLGGGIEIADINSELSVVSRQQIFRFRAAYDVRHNYTIVARAQRVNTSNPGFVAGPQLRQNLYQLELVRAF